MAIFTNSSTTLAAAETPGTPESLAKLLAASANALANPKQSAAFAATSINPIPFESLLPPAVFTKIAVLSVIELLIREVSEFVPVSVSPGVRNTCVRSTRGGRISRQISGYKTNQIEHTV